MHAFIAGTFKGFVMKVGFLPFAPWCWGRINSSSDEPYQMYQDIGGSDIVVLQTICQGR